MTHRPRHHLNRPRHYLIGIATIIGLLTLARACGERASLTEPTPPRTAQFDMTLSQGTVPYSTATVVTCSDAAITVSGNGTLTYRLREDNSGGLHQDTDIDERLTGIDIGGITYSGSSTTKTTTNVPMPSMETTTIWHTRLSAQGLAPDHMFHSTFHVTMNANGAITSSVFNYTCD